MSKVATKKKDQKITETLYQMIKTPVITEKSTLGSQHNQLTFRVPLSADKAIIKAAIEAIFKVKVTKVNTSRQQGKQKIFKGRLGQRNETKKAIVTLADGQMIDVATGV